jgi:hypothetical protein
LVSTPEAKRSLGKAFHADIVEMESYWIARMASAGQIPFMAVRAVSDLLRDSLPPFDRLLDSNARWRWKKAALYFVSSPQQLMRLPALYRNARQARRSLTTFVDRLIASY